MPPTQIGFFERETQLNCDLCHCALPDTLQETTPLVVHTRCLSQTARRYDHAEKVWGAARKISVVLAEFDGDYRRIDQEIWEAFWELVDKDLP
jgi:hypothetical protein